MEAYIKSKAYSANWIINIKALSLAKQHDTKVVFSRIGSGSKRRCRPSHGFESFMYIHVALGHLALSITHNPIGNTLEANKIRSCTSGNIVHSAIVEFGAHNDSASTTSLLASSELCSDTPEFTVLIELEVGLVLVGIDPGEISS